MIELSVILSTRNRASCVRDAVKSIAEQTFAPEKYEIIVVDNGSTDSTKEELDQLISMYGDKLRYYYAEEPGLHVGRHLGAEKSKGHILVYTDDDIIADKGWLQAVYDSFKDEEVALVGGKILPKWESDLPEWIDLFKVNEDDGWWLGYLSLLDFGEKCHEISPSFVFGCNYSIRKDVLYRCGGFHPDSVPEDRIKYRGDGETGLSIKIAKKGLKTMYNPGALVYHRIPVERLTVEYFCKRAFNQGVSASFTEIRKNRGLRESVVLKDVLKSLLKNFSNMAKSCEAGVDDPFVQKVKTSLKDGIDFHRKEVSSDSELLAYVLQEKYY